MMPTPLALKLGSTGALARARATAVAWTAAAMLAALALPLAAQAYVTYDFAFRSTDISGNAMDGAVSGSGHTFSFTSLSAANACNPTTDAGCAVIDVLLRTALPLFSASV